MGLFESKEAASKTMQSMKYRKEGEIKSVVGTSLETAVFQLDLVIIEDKPEKIHTPHPMHGSGSIVGCQLILSRGTPASLY